MKYIVLVAVIALTIYLVVDFVLEIVKKKKNKIGEVEDRTKEKIKKD